MSKIRPDLRGIVACCSSLIVAICLASCGKAMSHGTGSETHWLRTCSSDAQCESGSCECGVCTEPCSTTSDCSGVPVPGVECTTLAACGAAAGNADESIGACLLSCDADADCAALGAAASCRAGRCATPGAGLLPLPIAPEMGDGPEPLAGDLESRGEQDNTGAALDTGVEPTGAGGSAKAPSPSVGPLCDGSSEVRLVHYESIGYSDLDPWWFDEGPNFFVLDGQCRFWEAPNGRGRVRSGILDPMMVEELARSIDFGNQASWPATGDDCVGPDAIPAAVLWTEERTSHCCRCSGADVDADVGLGRALVFMSWQRMGGAGSNMFRDGEGLSGPARLGLSSLSPLPDRAAAAPWPLPRPPADSEMIGDGASIGARWQDDAWGSLVMDELELELLRALRDRIEDGDDDVQHTPLLVSTPDVTEPRALNMLLEDVLPEQVARALQRARNLER